MEQAEFLVEANVFILKKYKSAAAAAREYNFTGSYLTESLKGNRPLPSKLLTDMGYTETRTVVFTYEVDDGHKRDT